MQLGFERWDEVRVMENPAGYVYRVGRNAARSRRKPLPTIDPDVAERYGFEPRPARRAEPSERQAVLLVHAGGATLAEAAATLGISVSTLRNPLARGLERLRQPPGTDHAMIDLDNQLAAYARYLDGGFKW